VGRLTPDEQARIAAVVARVKAALQSPAPVPDPNATAGAPSLPGPVIPVMAGDGEGRAAFAASSWLYDVTGVPISLADFYQVRQFRVRGCPTTFWYARTETVMAQLLGQGKAPGLIWTEDELLETLLHPDLTEGWLQALVAVRLGLNDGVWPVSAPGRTIPWPKPTVSFRGSRPAQPPREPGDESETEEPA
jgi:hypothetical protein